MKNELTVHTRDLMRKMTMTIHVRGQREQRVRIWIGAHLIKMAAYVMGVGRLEFYMERENEPE